MLLITGADGFIGRHLCRHALAHGLAVRGAVRTLGPAGTPAGWPDAPPGIAWWASGDIFAGPEWAPALEGVQAVIHLAGRAHLPRARSMDTERAHAETAVAAAMHLGRAALAAGVPRLVYVSTLHVHGPASGTTPLSEHAPIRPHNAYAQGKWAAEETFRALGRQGLEPVVVRPALVCGPGVKGNLLRLLHWMAGGWPLPLRSLRNARSLVGVESLCALLLAAALRPEAAGEAFLAADEPPLSTPALVRALAVGMGRPARLLPAPPPMVGALLRMAGQGERWRQLAGSLVADGSKARAFLGQPAATSLPEALAATGRWYASLARNA